ncbi:TetR/AcrR family transcriptional regulator C-terminal domain-containing protein [Oceanobacillus neutriphilus]|uniref:Transcriptional regulator, TetR family protein n=1 Tax=Oceanobacillus neutriphilus TaxID=531815 RepID=A0ABQ2NQI0_9BACI|nr:TetR/AcrR family transcriptional regulator C-terminal domain-containing protein [Oceanobacillus neutriphilus]GGP08713.1 putative transcriptional regulator, TetR family protein [Oceanobacillus neutriphilus]
MGSTRTTQSDVIQAALHILNESGIEAVTLRAVAKRLGVYLNTVSWQVKTKSRLIELMADTIFSELSLDELPEQPEERTKEILRRLRSVLLTHRDGAKLVTGTTVYETNTLRIGDAIISALLQLHLPHKEAVRIFWTLAYFTFGLVQEEQGDSVAYSDSKLQKTLATDEYPAFSRVLTSMYEDSFDDRFEYGIHCVLTGAFQLVDNNEPGIRKGK